MDQVQNDRRSFVRDVVQTGGNVSRRRGPSGVSSMLMFCLRRSDPAVPFSGPISPMPYWLPFTVAIIRRFTLPFAMRVRRDGISNRPSLPGPRLPSLNPLMFRLSRIWAPLYPRHAKDYTPSSYGHTVWRCGKPGK